MEPEEYQKLFELEDEFWWFLGMREISRVLLERFLQRGGSKTRVLDAGCGTGGMLRELRDFGQAYGLDESTEAIRLARKRLAVPLVRGDVCGLPFASESFDLVTSFDVLYHSRVLSDDRALREMARVLRPQGLLLLRVPAMDFLRGRHDVAVHTRHRYAKREIEDKLEGAGFLVQFTSFLNLILLPIAMIRRGAETLRPPQRGSEVEPVAAWLNQVLYGALWVEARWIRFAPLPLGLSLVAVARRK